MASYVVAQTTKARYKNFLTIGSLTYRGLKRVISLAGLLVAIMPFILCKQGLFYYNYGTAGSSIAYSKVLNMVGIALILYNNLPKYLKSRQPYYKLNHRFLKIISNSDFWVNTILLCTEQILLVYGFAFYNPLICILAIKILAVILHYRAKTASKLKKFLTRVLVSITLIKLFTDFSHFQKVLPAILQACEKEKPEISPLSFYLNKYFPDVNGFYPQKTRLIFPYIISYIWPSRNGWLWLFVAVFVINRLSRPNTTGENSRIISNLFSKLIVGAYIEIIMKNPMLFDRHGPVKPVLFGGLVKNTPIIKNEKSLLSVFFKYSLLLVTVYLENYGLGLIISKIISKTPLQYFLNIQLSGLLLVQLIATNYVKKILQSGYNNKADFTPEDLDTGYNYLTENFYNNETPISRWLELQKIMSYFYGNYIIQGSAARAPTSPEEISGLATAIRRYREGPYYRRISAAAVQARYKKLLDTHLRYRAGEKIDVALPQVCSRILWMPTVYTDYDNGGVILSHLKFPILKQIWGLPGPELKQDKSNSFYNIFNRTKVCASGEIKDNNSNMVHTLPLKPAYLAKIKAFSSPWQLHHLMGYSQADKVWTLLYKHNIKPEVNTRGYLGFIGDFLNAIYGYFRPQAIVQSKIYS